MRSAVVALVLAAVGAAAADPAHGLTVQEAILLAKPAVALIKAEVGADACFVFIGASPRTDWLSGVVARDERGFILAGPDVPADGWPLPRDPYVLETSVPGVFVAGDVRARSVKRVASAVGEGSMAVSLIHQYLADT